LGPYTYSCHSASTGPTVLDAGNGQTVAWIHIDWGRADPNEVLLRIGTSGVTPLNLDPIEEVARSIVPSGGALFVWSQELVAGATLFTYSVPVYPDCPPFKQELCDESIGGKIDVDFHIDGDHLTPLGRKYTP